jgi:hypothetical protein
MIKHNIIKILLGALLMTSPIIDETITYSRGAIATTLPMFEDEILPDSSMYVVMKDCLKLTK